MIVIRRFARTYMLPLWWWYLAGVIALLATNWLAVTIPLYLAEAIDALGTPAGPDTALNNAVAVAFMGILMMGIRTLSRVAFFTPGRLVEARAKRDLFETILKQQPAFLAQWPTGDIVSRASSDMNQLRLLAGFGALSICNVTFVLVLTGGQMARISLELTLWVLAPLAVGFVLTQVFIRRMFVLVRRMQRQLATLSDHILSSYQGIATIQGFAAEEAFRRDFDIHNKAYLTTTLQRANLRVAIGPTLAISASVSVFLLLLIGGAMVASGEGVTKGELVAFISLLAYLTGPLRGVSFVLAIVKQAQSSLERLYEVMSPAPERPDLPDPVPPPDTPPTLAIRSLSFAYPGGPDVLHDVSVTIEAGKTLGILGPTGSGKSTLLTCIARLHNPPAGTITVDGTDVRALDLDRWREVMVFVPQRAWLFSESIASNIIMASGDRSRLEETLRLTTLSTDIAALPQGVDTVVGESGVMLSGGQRQRTALARGLLREPRLLLLDDVLSAVDHTTEQALLAGLQERPDRPTTVIAAHRISALQGADLVLVLDDGRVADVGTHAELIDRPGLYRDTWEQQTDDPGAAP